MRYRTITPGHDGTTVVEAVVVLGVFLMLVVGMLDLGSAVFRQHQISYAARSTARAVSVHGSTATVLGPWGATTVGPIPTSSDGAIPEEFRLHLCALDPSAVSMQVDWPDGDNQPGSRAVVTLETSYQPILTGLFGSGPIPLRAVSTMPISH